MKKTIFATIALIAMASLSACAPARSKPSARVIPDVPSYSKAVQAKAADEMISGGCPVLSDVMMPDYGVMRDQARAAKKILK